MMMFMLITLKTCSTISVRNQTISLLMETIVNMNGENFVFLSENATEIFNCNGYFVRKPTNKTHALINCSVNIKIKTDKKLCKLQMLLARPLILSGSNGLFWALLLAEVNCSPDYTLELLLVQIIWLSKAYFIEI